MEMEGQLIKSTAGEIAAELRQRGVDPSDPVTVLVGRPSLSVIARRLQTEAAGRGMTDEIHDKLMSGAKKPR
jgi:hypothetical protein